MPQGVAVAVGEVAGGTVALGRAVVVGVTGGGLAGVVLALGEPGGVAVDVVVLVGVCVTVGGVVGVIVAVGGVPVTVGVGGQTASRYSCVSARQVSQSRLRSKPPTT